MATMSLPPVAKSFYTFCKKCDTDRYHMVMTHTSPTQAKMKCEVCGKTMTWSLPKTSSTPAGSRPKSTTGTARGRASHREQWELLLSSNATATERPYNLKAKFEVNTLLNHPKFGRGFIKEVQGDKIFVVFEDEVKTLMHNRT